MEKQLIEVLCHSSHGVGRDAKQRQTKFVWRGLRVPSGKFLQDILTTKMQNAAKL